MNLFGWTVTISRRATRARQRADRNAAAMTSSVGMAALPGQAVAARIHREEIDLAVGLLRVAAGRQWIRAAFDKQVHTYDPAEFAATLHQRLGAAAAVEANVEFAPILAEEIALLEQAVKDLDEDDLLRHRVLDGQPLLEDLHQRMGHAAAVHYLGGVVPVFTTPISTVRPAAEHDPVRISVPTAE